MITSIAKVYGIGRYGHYDGPVEIQKNQVIFGFNGAGKSTLSDIFYSLKNDEDHLEPLSRRHTLTTDEGQTPENQMVELSTDGEPLCFDGEHWNRTVNIHVFNDQYIDEYLFIGDSYADGGRPIGLGAKETQKLTKKQQCETELAECLDTVNQVLINNKEACRKANLGQSRIRMDKWARRVKKFAELASINGAQREEIRRNHDEPDLSNPIIRSLRSWINRLSELYVLQDSGGAAIMRGISKLLQDTPEITGREIAAHMQAAMGHADPAWLVQGRRYQKREDLCPYCGQEITDPNFRKLAKDLDRFISGKQKEKAARIKQKAEKAKTYLDAEKLQILQDVLEEIHTENAGKRFLYKRTLNLTASLQFSTPEWKEYVYSLVQKLDRKLRNPYEKIVLTLEERLICGTVERILDKFNALQSKLKDEQNRCTEQLRTQQEYELQDGLYEVFFGPNRENFQNAINCAIKMFDLDEMIQSLQKELGKMLDEHKLADVNRFLEEVNVNFTVNIVDNSYQVKIRGYKSSEYQKENKLLCSEGERRMLAFAYFLQEVEEDPENKIIVVDDPVSSMDSSRRSVVAYKLMTLMQKANNQVIVLSHDLFFVERLNALGEKLKDSPLGLMQINKYGVIFSALDLQEYLVTDEKVYEQIIRNGIASDDERDKMVAWIAMRPYVSVMTQGDGAYLSIEGKASYLAHSRYSQSKNVHYKSEDYSIEAMKAYCNSVNQATGQDFDGESLCAAGLFNEDGVFTGFDYARTWELYAGLSMDTMLELREKALVFRLVLETSLYMMRDSNKPLNLERIGSEYNKLKKSSEASTRDHARMEKRKLCLMLCKLYEFSKKYHHGADDGSTLGLSALNPEEMHQYDEEICKIHDWIAAHPKVIP